MKDEGKEVVVEVKNLAVSYDGNRVIEEINLTVSSQQIVGIIGPNGAGKSTLIKAIMGLVKADVGKVAIMSQHIDNMRRKIAYVPQRSDIDMDFPVLVDEVVMMGRYPHLAWWKPPGTQDKELVKAALKQVGMWELRKRQIGRLSGGQQQRVFVARALAQQAEIFFLDEPFAGIDVASEQMIMDVLKQLPAQGKTLFVVHHDLSKAESYFDNLILLNNKLIAYGKGKDVIKANFLREAYGDGACAFASDTELLVVNG